MPRTVTIELSDEQSEIADRAGLLTNAAIEQLMHKEIRRRAATELYEMTQPLRDANFPPMSVEEIAEIVKAERRERRSQRATGT